MDRALFFVSFCFCPPFFYMRSKGSFNSSIRRVKKKGNRCKRTDGGRQILPAPLWLLANVLWLRGAPLLLLVQVQELSVFNSLLWLIFECLRACLCVRDCGAFCSRHTSVGICDELPTLCLGSLFTEEDTRRPAHATPSLRAAGQITCILFPPAVSSLLVSPRPSPHGVLTRDFEMRVNRGAKAPYRVFHGEVRRGEVHPLAVLYRKCVFRQRVLEISIWWCHKGQRYTPTTMVFALASEATVEKETLFPSSLSKVQQYTRFSRKL